MLSFYPALAKSDSVPYNERRLENYFGILERVAILSQIFVLLFTNHTKWINDFNLFNTNIVICNYIS